ncbi:MAG: hypothetical protein JXR95_03585 [Deltaproteobacteria bacterium]|nr:hypothetical protein [Deltaproteobacteria bacterium]
MKDFFTKNRIITLIFLLTAIANIVNWFMNGRRTISLVFAVFFFLAFLSYLIQEIKN